MKGHFLSGLSHVSHFALALIVPGTVRGRYPLYGYSLTNICACNRRLWCPEAQTNVLVLFTRHCQIVILRPVVSRQTHPSSTALARTRSLDLGLGIEENVRLLLISTLRLDSQLGRHLDGSWWRCGVDGGTSF